MIIRPPQQGHGSGEAIIGGLGILSVGRGCWHIEKLAAVGKLVAAMAVGREAVIANAMEAIGQDVHQEAADELAGGKPHDLDLVPAVLAVVLPAEADVIVAELDQAAVGDGDPMRVAGEISEDLRGTGKGRLGVDDPFDPPQRREVRLEAGRAVRGSSSPKNCSLPAPCSASRPCRNKRRNRRDSTRTGRKKLGRHATQRVPSGAMPPPGTMQCTCG